MSIPENRTARAASTNLPVIDAAYVWQVASEWRAHREFDDANLDAGQREFSLTLPSGQTGPLHTAVRMIGDQFTIHTHPYRGKTIVAIDATYRSVPMCIHTTVHADTADALIEALRATALGVQASTEGRCV